MIDQCITTMIACVCTQFLRGIDHDHRHTDALGRTRIHELRLQQSRYRGILHTTLEDRNCTVPSNQVSRCLRPGRSSYDVKSLRKIISALADRASVAGHMEKHPAVRVKTVFIQKFHAQPRAFQPLGTLLHGVVQRGEHPYGSGLYPDALVVIDQRTVSIPHQQKSSIFMIEGTGKPERYGVRQQLPVIEISKPVQLFQ